MSTQSARFASSRARDEQDTRRAKIAPLLAAGMSVRAISAAVTALVSLYGLFASPAAISDQLALLSGILPDSAVEIFREQIGRLTANSSKLGLGFIFGLRLRSGVQILG